jgi:hypothetical protein
MSRKTLGAFIATALLSLPAIAMAKQQVWTPRQVPTNSSINQTTMPLHPIQGDRLTNGGPNTLSTVGTANNTLSPGNVTGPGTKARIDTSVKGPLNDINPGGQPSEDTSQAAHPPQGQPQ